MPKGITNRGVRGLEIQDQPLKLKSASWIEPTGGFVTFDDFTGDTLATDPWLATDTGAGNTVFAVNAAAGAPVAGHGGWISAATAATAINADEIAGLAIFRPSRAGNGVVVFQTRINLPNAVTATNYCAGFTALRTYADGLAMSMSAGDTFVTTAANGACWLYDTRGTADVNFGLTVDNNVDSAATEALATNGVVPVAGKSRVLRIELDAVGNAYFYEGVDDLPDTAVFKGMQAAAGSTLKATLLAPYVGIDNAAAANAKQIDIDYILAAGAR